MSQWHDHIESKVCNNQDPKSFYVYTNSKLKDHSFIPPLKTANGEFAMSDKDTTEVLNATFQSVFDGYNIKFDCLHSVARMESFEITTQDISTALAKMSCKVSQTPEGIPAYFLMRMAPSIIVVLCYLFNLSPNSSKLPYQWKQAVVIAINKKGCSVQNNNLIFILSSAPLKSLMRIAVDLKRNF